MALVIHSIGLQRCVFNYIVAIFNGVTLVTIFVNTNIHGVKGVQCTWFVAEKNTRGKNYEKSNVERDEKERMGSTYLFEGFMVSMHDTELFFFVLFFFLFVCCYGYCLCRFIHST